MIDRFPLAHQYAPLEVDEELLPSPQELEALLDDLSTDFAELDEEVPVDD